MKRKKLIFSLKPVRILFFIYSGLDIFTSKISSFAVTFVGRGSSGNGILIYRFWLNKTILFLVVEIDFKKIASNKYFNDILQGKGKKGNLRKPCKTLKIVDEHHSYKEESRSSSSEMFCKKVFLKTLQNPQEKICVRVSLLKKLLLLKVSSFNKETRAQVFPCGFCKIFKNTFLLITSGAASGKDG